MALMLSTEGETRASIAGLVIAGFAVGGIIYTFVVSKVCSTLLGRKAVLMVASAAW